MFGQKCLQGPWERIIINKAEKSDWAKAMQVLKCQDKECLYATVSKTHEKIYFFNRKKIMLKKYISKINLAGNDAVLHRF